MQKVPVKIILLLFIFIRCNKPNDVPPPEPQKSNDKEIVSFQLLTANNMGMFFLDITATVTPDSILLNVPFGTNLINLKPTIKIKGKDVSPSNITAQNFTASVNYTVTAENGTKKMYATRVNVEPLAATLFISSSNPGIGGYAKLYAIDANTGMVKWIYNTTAMVTTNAAFSGGVIYTGFDNDIVAIDTLTKTHKWKYKTGGTVHSAPLVINGRVYANSDDQCMYALDAVTGNLLWKFAQNPNPVGGGNYSSPTFADGVVYFGSTDQYIYAVDAVSGLLKWKTFHTNPLGAGYFQSSPSVAGGSLYIGDAYRNIIALNTVNGNINWTYRVVDASTSSPTVDNGVVYIGSLDNNLYAINAVDGTLKWKYVTNVNIRSSPIVTNGIVYFGTDGPSSSNFYAVDAATGVLKWSYFSQYGFYNGGASVFNGTVFINSHRILYALNSSTGKLKWQFTTEMIHDDMSLSSPLIVDANSNVHYSSISGHQN